MPESGQDQLFRQPELGRGRNEFLLMLETVTDGDIAKGYFFGKVHVALIIIIQVPVKVKRTTPGCYGSKHDSYCQDNPFLFDFNPLSQFFYSHARE